MKDRARQGASSRRSHLGRLLVAFQVALSVVLLVGASLFLRTLRNLYAVDAGFRSGQVMIVSLQMLPSTYDRPVPHPVRMAVWDRLLTGVRALPGVQSAGLSAMTPLDGSGRGIYLDVPGYVRPSDEDGRISLNTVSEDYFASLGTRIIGGRDLGRGDGLGAPAVALLNQSAARHFFDRRDPIGTIVKPNEYSYRIVGIVADVKHKGLREEAGRFIYVPFRQPMDRGLAMTLSIRTFAGSGPPIAAIQRLVRDIGPDILVTRTDTLARQVDESLLTERVVSLLASAFGALALALSAIGLYGVLAYSVSRETPEIGIRMALGAEPGQVARGILGQTLWLVTAGLAAGIPASVFLARMGERLLFGVTPSDAITQAGVAMLLLCVCIAASLVPALRAARIAPSIALRSE
ncbi:MAG TPA: FtsX-like permease family protein [Bryobacteraceae bacterium]|nr:FtsX-like permease family protein [Bryobacteraceae bacterium]